MSSKDGSGYDDNGEWLIVATDANAVTVVAVAGVVAAAAVVAVVAVVAVSVVAESSFGEVMMA